MIDFTQIPLARTGVGVYGDNLIREILQFLTPDDVLLVLVQSDDELFKLSLDRPARIRLIQVPSGILRNRAALLLFEQLVLPFVLLAYRVDLLHSLHYTHPLFSPCKRVVTIHDLTFMLFPELHTRGRRLIMPFFIRNAMRRADAVIFVSESTRRDALRLVAGSKAEGAVVPLGVDQCYREGSTSADIDMTLDKLDVTRPFIFNVGTLEPRKNIPNLIQAFEHIANADPNVTLVLAGKLGWGYDEVLQKISASRHYNRIKHVGFISDKEKRGLLNACTIFVYPSLYEGFGLPVLEAMAAGAPVITSAGSSLAEVAGDAAELVDPKSCVDLTRALSNLLVDGEKRCALQAAGKQRCSQFTWTRTALCTYGVYARVHTNSAPPFGEC